MRVKFWLLRLVHLIFLAGTLAIFGWASYNVVHYLRTAPPFEVKALTVTGVNGPLKRVTEGEIVGQAEFEVGTNVFRVDLDAIRQHVEWLPWVRHAMVQRVLPDQIVIKVAERKPIGLARIRGEMYQFDEDAVILDIDNASNVSSPILDGLRRNNKEANLRKVAIFRNVLDELG